MEDSRDGRRGTAVKRTAYWVIGGILALVVLVSAGTFIYIHFIEGSAPKPLSLSDVTTTTSESSGGATTSAAGGSSGARVPIAGSWAVASSGSTVGYRVKEVLFGQDNTAVGRTTAVTGAVTISGTSVTKASFTADMTKVSSDRSQRDNQFQGRIMNTSQYPTATFSLTSPISIAPVPTDKTVKSYTATGNLTMHGTTKSVTFTLEAQRNGAQLDLNGSIPVTFSDWNIPNPTFGPITTEDHGQMEFLIVLQKS
jgi:polyisoprenoid-binding protein YceI